jgi:PAS domain S-box-containing protein
MKENLENNAPILSYNVTEGLLLSVIRSMQDLLFVLDEERNFIHFFQQNHPSLILPADLFIGKNIKDIGFPEESLDAITTTINIVEQTGKTQQVDYTLPMQDGRHWFNASISAINFENYKSGFVVVIREITKRKLLEEALSRSEDLYRILATNVADIVALYSMEGIIEYMSPSAERLLGYSMVDWVGKSPLEFIHPDDRKYVTDIYFTADKDPNQLFQFRYRILNANGRWVPFESKRSYIKDKKGNIVNVIATCHDITEREAAETALRKSEQHYRMLADNILNMVTLHNTDGYLAYVSPSCTGVLGYSPEEMVKIHPINLIHPEDRNMMALTLENAIKGKDKFKCDLRLQHKNGEWRYCESTVKIIEDAAGKVINILATTRDVNQWRIDQKALKESEEKYRSLVESSDAMIGMIDKDGTFIFVNDRRAEFYNLPKSEIIGKNIREFYSQDEGDLFMEDIQVVFSEGKKIVFKESTVMMHGKEFWLSINALPVLNAEGKVYAAMFSSIDITNIKKSEEMLRKQNEELKEIAFLQSHIIRSPVTNIQALLHLVHTQELSQINKTYFDLMKEAADNLDDIIREIVDRVVAIRK